jgi:molecular chaperone DnaK (HSP70)
VAEVGREYEITDRAPLSLGIEVEGGVMKIVIQKDTPTPCHRFHARLLHQACMHLVHVFSHQ